jgi:hypothetical protein
MAILEDPFGKNAGVIFPPPGIREAGARVDFRKDISFDAQIEWHGVRLAWSRMTLCPCKGFNDETDQFDPDCPRCNARGWTTYQTPDYVIDQTKVGALDPIQSLIVSRGNCMVIRGVPMSMTEKPSLYEALGNWAFGSVMFTVRPENKLGYYDRLTHLDDVAPFSEIVTTESDLVKLRYPATCLNALLSSSKTYGDADVVLEDGNVKFLSGKAPALGTRLSVSYLHHPTFVVLEFPHLIRVIPARAIREKAGTSPAGGHFYLPQQVLARLEYLPMDAKTP